eukprot:gene35617-43195_t
MNRIEEDGIARRIVNDFFAAQCRDTKSDWTLETISVGLINTTWKVVCSGKPCYVLQKINDKVFTNPPAIDSNIRMLASYIESEKAVCPFPKPVAFYDHVTLLYVEEHSYFRLFDYIPCSRTYTAVISPSVAYEAAKQFGAFARAFSSFDANSLLTTIPNFHNLRMKYDDFLCALRTGLTERIEIAKDLIDEVQKCAYICSQYDDIVVNRQLEVRVVHHDAKISNMLFSENADVGICVVDLDTVMPGYFISDLGDLFRSSLCAYDEETTDLSLLSVRLEYFDAIVQGYLSAMRDVLTASEKHLIVYAGQFMIYMQCLRFLTDFLLGDKYYKFSHSLHNLDRAKNQMTLLKSYLSQEARMNEIVQALL